MEAVKKVTELDPRDAAVVERLLGQSLNASDEVVLTVRTADSKLPPPDRNETGVPAWCDVLEGMSDDDLADFQSLLELPVRLSRAED